jgi:predicted HAD superfamily Cof-like phosphohydrolase
MNTEITKVRDFHEKFNIGQASTPEVGAENLHDLRHRLMAEENDEYLDACKKGDIVGIADAIGDMLYIAYGTANVHGLHHLIKQVFDEIHDSNMSKLGEDGKPIMREDGKVLKGPGYFRPDIKSIIDPN